MHNIVFHEKVQHFLENKDRKFLLNFQSKMTLLRKDPFTRELDVKPLKGLLNCYRLRIRGFRFLYELGKEKRLIIFFDAGTRGNIYK